MSSPASTSDHNNQRRRRPKTTSTAGEPFRRRPSLLDRRNSLTRDIEHAAAETYLITHLAFKLLSYLGVGYRWISKLLQLCLYALFLMPGFIQVGYQYFFSSQIRRSIVYGDLPRNRLDLYLPKNTEGLKPVVAFVTGGAWTIGYKAWGSLLGQQLAEREIIVACIDYRIPSDSEYHMENDSDSICLPAILSQNSQCSAILSLDIMYAFLLDIIFKVNVKHDPGSFLLLNPCTFLKFLFSSDNSPLKPLKALCYCFKYSGSLSLHLGKKSEPRSD